MKDLKQIREVVTVADQRTLTEQLISFGNVDFWYGHHSDTVRVQVMAAQVVWLPDTKTHPLSEQFGRIAEAMRAVIQRANLSGRTSVVVDEEYNPSYSGGERNGVYCVSVTLVLKRSE